MFLINCQTSNCHDSEGHCQFFAQQNGDKSEN